MPHRILNAIGRIFQKDVPQEQSALTISGDEARADQIAKADTARAATYLLEAGRTAAEPKFEVRNGE